MRALDLWEKGAITIQEAQVAARHMRNRRPKFKALVTDPNKPPSVNYTFFSMDNWSDASNYYMKEVHKFGDWDWDDIMMNAKPFIRSRSAGASEPPPVPDDNDTTTGLEMRETIESDSDEAVEEIARQQRAPVPVRQVVFDEFPAAGGRIRPPSHNPPTFEEIPRQQRAPVPARPVVIHEYPADRIRPPSHKPPTSYPTSYPTFRYPAGEGASYHPHSHPPPDRLASRRPQQVMSHRESSAHPRGMPVYQGGIANKSALPSSSQASSRAVTVDIASSFDRTHVGSPNVVAHPMGEDYGMDTPIISFSDLMSNVEPPYQDDGDYIQDMEAGMYYRDSRACAAGDREYYDMDGYDAEPSHFGMSAFCAMIHHLCACSNCCFIVIPRGGRVDRAVL